MQAFQHPAHAVGGIHTNTHRWRAKAAWTKQRLRERHGWNTHMHTLHTHMPLIIDLAAPGDLDVVVGEIPYGDMFGLEMRDTTLGDFIG